MHRACQHMPEPLEILVRAENMSQTSAAPLHLDMV